MRTFVINLDKNTERLAKFDAQMQQYGLPYERIRAIYGKELLSDAKKMATNRFAWWCIKGYEMRDGELGAALSHQLAYRAMIEQNISLACVFEDDANPNENLSEQIRRIEQCADIKRPQIYLLADHSLSKRTDWSIRRLRGGAFAEGYILTLSAARALLNDNYPVKTPADSWSYWARKGIVELFQTTPASCDQAWEAEGYVSNITTDERSVIDVRRMNVFQKLIWKGKRAIGMLIAKIIY